MCISVITIGDKIDQPQDEVRGKNSGSAVKKGGDN